MTVDPELLRQLDAAGESDAPVAAAVSIRRARGVAPDPAKIQRAVRVAVDRAGRSSGSELSSLRVLGHLGVANVEGPARMVRALLDQPEITGAVTGQPGSQPSDEGSA